MYIIVEGLDGSGKTTITDKLTEWMQSIGFPTIKWHEPGTPEIETLIQKTKELKLADELKGFETRFKSDLFAMLFTADRYLMLPELHELLDQGNHVIADRSYLSTFAYQNISGDELLGMLNLFVEEPDIVLYLDIKPEIAYNRIIERDRTANDPFEKLQNLKQVKNNYDDVLNYIPATIYYVNANQSPDQVFHDCQKIISKLLGVTPDGELSE